MTYEPTEDPAIQRVAEQMGIDWRLLKALRQTENGRPGREFGVLAVPAPAWIDQAQVAARTIRHTIGRYWQNVREDPWDEAKEGYSADFLRYFSTGGPGWPGYAPVKGAENDPQGLNAHHLPNLLHTYAACCTAVV